jgi:hypothetical protein
MSVERGRLLERARAVSLEVIEAADRADLAALAILDAERLRLLKSLQPESANLSTGEQQVLKEISELNDRAIGLVEHHRRSKARELDMAAVGRRAVSAYSTTRQQR